jgi:Uma2 family endonuclease
MGNFMTITKNKIWTYEDYYNLEDDNRYEIIEGELIEMPSPGRIHQKISGNLYGILWNHLKKNKLGELYSAPFDTILSDINTFQPDILFISQTNLNVLQERGVFGSPDLVIEILSPTNPDHDKVKKFKVYEKFKVKEFWIIDPDEKTIEIFVLEEDKLISFCSAKGSERIQSKTFADIELSYQDLI